MHRNYIGTDSGCCLRSSIHAQCRYPDPRTASTRKRRLPESIQRAKPVSAANPNQQRTKRYLPACISKCALDFPAEPSCRALLQQKGKGKKPHKEKKNGQERLHYWTDRSLPRWGVLGMVGYPCSHSLIALSRSCHGSPDRAQRLAASRAGMHPSQDDKWLDDHYVIFSFEMP